MTLAWGWPLALVALAALAVPLLLHLDRRRAARMLSFAAFRWLASGARPRRTWRLREWLLLVLRLALVALLALWLAQPLLRGQIAAAQRWVAVVPGAVLPHGAVTVEDRIVWLAPGFPPHGDPAPDTTQPSASLLREFDARLAPDDTLTVVVPDILVGLDTRALQLSRPVAWHIVPGDAPRAAAPPRPRLVLRSVDPAAPALATLRAVIDAWSAVETRAVDVDEGAADIALPETFDALAWLGGPLPDAVQARLAQGATVLQVVATPDAPTWPPAETRLGRGRLLQIAAPFDATHTAVLQQPQVPELLHRALFGAPLPPARAFAEHVQPSVEPLPLTPRERPLRGVLAWCAVVLFLLERLLASGRRLVPAA